MAADTFVIVGASLAAATAAHVLRAEGFDGRIVLLGAEPHRPIERLDLRKVGLSGALAHDDIEVRLRTTVTSLDRSARDVVLDDGERIGYDRLLLATGEEPRRPGAPGDAACDPHVIQDGSQIRDALRTGPCVAIIGADWIGLETAAAARVAGLEVTVLDPAQLPVLRVRGRQDARVFAQLSAQNRVDRRVGARLAGWAGSGTGDSGAPTGVELGDRSFVAADLVLVAVGVTAVVALAADAGLDVTGARADAPGRTADAPGRTADPAVFTAGDVADANRLGRCAPVDRRESARQQGAAAARLMLGQSVAIDRGRYVFRGRPDAGTAQFARAAAARSHRVVLRGDAGRREFIGFWPADGRVLAGIDVNVWDEVDTVTKLVQNFRRTPPPRPPVPDVLAPLLAAVFAGI